MSQETDAARAKEESELLTDMLRNSKGWAVVDRLVTEMQTDAFEKWAALDIDAPISKSIPIKATQKVLADLKERIYNKVEEGKEATRWLEQQAEAQKLEIASRVLQKEADKELEALRAPLSTATTPTGAAENKQ